MDIKTVRQQYPQYNDLSDEQLAEGLYKRYYSDLPRTDFYSRLGFEQAPPIDAPELTKGLKTGYEQVKMMPQVLGTQMDANALDRQQQLLSAFDKIDRGEQISPTDTQMGIRDFAQVKGYQTATPEERERLRQSQMGQIKESALSVDEGLKLFEQFKKETAQYAGKTPDLTDVDSAGAFADWLSYNVGAAAPQVVPMVAAAIATRGRSLPFTMGASMGVQESVSNRIDYIQDKTKDLPEDQRVDETIKYLQDTGTVSTLTGLGVGALDLFGPVGSALRRRVAQEIAKKTGKDVAEETARTGVKGALKDVPRDVLEEGVTGAAQSLLQIGSEQYLGEQTGDVFSGENVKRVINDAAAEAAGGLAGSGVNLTTESGKSLFKKRVKSIAEKKLADMQDPADVIKAAVKGKVPETPAIETQPQAEAQPTPPAETQATETYSAPGIDVSMPAQDQQAMEAEVREMQGLPPEESPAVTPTSTQLPLTEDQPSADIPTPPEPVGIRTIEELRRQARSLGIDPDAILNEVSLREDLTQEQFDQEYESTIRQEISRRLDQADPQQVDPPETSALPQEGSQTLDTIPTPTTPPPTVGYRPQSDAEKSMFGTSKVVDFGVGNAQINFDSDTIFLSRPDGSRRGGPSDDAIIRPGDNRRNVIKRPEDFPDYVPDAARQPLIDYANIMAEQRKRFPNTREGRQELQSVMEDLPVTRRLNTALEALSPQQVGQAEPVAAPQASTQATATPRPSTPRRTTAEQFGYDPVAFEETGLYTPVPVEQGGQLFPNKREAISARKGQAGTKIKPVKGGYVLTPKTPKDLAADAKRAQRLKEGPSRPLALEEFLAYQGGLSKSLQSELRADRNIQYGNKWLFAGANKPGLNESQAFELAEEAGYISPDENIFDAINESLAEKSRYSIRDMDEVAENQYTDYVNAYEEQGARDALEENGIPAEKIDAVGITEPRQQAEVAALIARANDLGVDVYGIEEAVATRSESLDNESYEAEVAREIERAVAQAEQGDVQDTGEAPQPPLDDDIPFGDIVPPKTEEFNTWFGDSKVVDSNQNPVLVYHGTNQDVNEFTTQPNAIRPRFYAGEIGSWFGDNPTVANNFARGISSPRGGGAVYPAFLSIKNPKVYNSYQEFLSAAKGRRSAPAMRRDLIKQGYDGIHIKDSDTDFGGRRDDWVAFHPEQIKSAFNLRPTSDPSIIRDVQSTYPVTGEVKTVADLEALNADIRAAKISEYQSVKRRLSEVQRRRIRNEARRFDDETERSLYETAETLKAEIEMSQPERRTPEDFMARAAKALADGDISKDVYDVIDAMFKKNPALLNGLQLSIRAGQDGSAGQFIPLIRMVKLFKGYGAYNPSTVRHEISHSMEQMMAPEARAKVIDEWRKAVSSAKKANQSEQAQKFFQTVENFIANPSADNYNATIQALPSYEYYQFINPSEYWAVNAEKLMQSYLDSGWQRFKSSMKGFLEAIKKVLRLKNTHAIYSTFNDLITKPRGRESTTMLVGYMNENVPIMDKRRRNYEGNPAPPATFESPPGVTSQGVLGPISKTNFRYNFQDKMIDLKDAQKAIEKTGKTVDDLSDAYTKETLYYGRTANQSKEFLTKEVKPVLSKMQKFKVTPEELSAYLLAKHAPERNAYIATINPSFPDGGAGITTAEANAYIDTLSPERRQQLESLGDDMRSIILGTHDIEVKGGLEEQAVIDAWRTTWPDYVPLFRTEVDYVNGGSGLGQGFDVRGPSSKRAVGSSRDIKDIFSSIIEQRERAIVRAEKNRIGQGLYALSIQNPNADWWLPINPDAVTSKGALVEELDKLGISPQEAENLMSPPKVATVVRVPLPDGSYHEQVQYRVSSNANFSDNVVGLRVNGKNRYVIFNPNNERSKRLANSLKNLDAEQLDFLNQRIGNVTRFIASMSTQYNPLFGAWNFYRDWQSAALNLSTTPLRGKQAVIVFDAFKMIPKMYQEYRATRSGRDAQGEVPTLLREFLTEGAQSGYREQFEKLTARGTIVERELAKLNAGNVKTVVNAVGGWLSDYNDVLENAIRLSAYKQAKKMNMTNQQAARLAKEITVNFNRKGAKTPGMSALYAFFNAAVQGTDRMIDTLTGPAGKKIVAGGMLLGVVQALVLEAMGFEEDEPTDFIKQKNLIIPIGGGDYVMWPMPLGFNFLPNVGRILTEMTLGGKKKARDRVAELLAVMVDSFNPLGGAGFLQTLSPTVLDPFIAVSENKDAFGRPVSREDFATNPKPGYLRSRQNATEFSKLFAEALNSISGGTKYTPGLVSPTGDDLDYIVGQYLGGVGREVQRMYELGKSQVTGEELETYRIPLFGKIYGKTDSPAATAARFYSTVTRMAEHQQEIKGRRDTGRDPQGYILANPEARLYKYTNNMENKISKLNTRIRQLQEDDPRDPRVEKLQERKTILMQLYLDRVKQLFPN